MSETTAAFCTECGSPLPAGAKFCGACGAKVLAIPARPAAPPPEPASPPPAAAPPPQPSAIRTAPTQPAPQPVAAPAEPALAIMSGVQQQKGFFGLKFETYTMIITPHRLVFAYLTNQQMNEAVRQARDAAKQGGAGFMGQWAAQLGWMETVVRRYQQMPIEATLREHERNFSLPLAQVRRITTFTESDDDGGRDVHKMRIETTNGKFEFNLGFRSADDARKIVQSALGPLVR